MTFAPKTILRNNVFNRDAVVNEIGELRVVMPIKLVGDNFSGAALDTQIWTSTLAGSGAVVLGSGEAQLRTNTTANSTVLVRGNRASRTIGNLFNYAALMVRLGDTGVTNNKRNWGAYDANNGYFFQLDGTTFKVVRRKAAADTQITAFNGITPVVDGNYHMYEIYYTSAGVWFLQDGNLVHELVVSTTPLIEATTTKLSMENLNSGGSTTDASLYVSSANIFRLGQLNYAPRAVRLNSAATTTLKSNPGTLVGLLIGKSGTGTADITIYDNTAASGTVIAVIDCAAQRGYIPIDVEFEIGLTVVTTTTVGDYTLLYD